MKIPNKVPEKGFYYHYKHDRLGPFNNYAYEIIGVGHHTEMDETQAESMMVVYRPLYKEALVYEMGKLFDLRPLFMFMQNVTKDGKTFPRFKKITDPKVIARLEEIKKEMYS